MRYALAAAVGGTLCRATGSGRIPVSLADRTITRAARQCIPPTAGFCTAVTLYAVRPPPAGTRCETVSTGITRS